MGCASSTEAPATAAVELPEAELPRVAKALKGLAAESWQAFLARNSDAHEIEALKAEMA